MDNYFSVVGYECNISYLQLQRPITLFQCILCFYFKMFQDSTKEVERLISKERYETVSSLDAGIERMAREKYAFLWTRETMDYLLAKNCTFTTLKGNNKIK